MAYWLEASVYSIGQDKINNYTNVRVDLWFCRDSGGAWSAYTTYGYITVDGQRQDFSVGSYDTSGRQHIATRDFRVYHNGDGSKNVAYYCYFNADNAPYVAGLDKSGNTGLPTIPRAAGINAVNWSNIESAFNVTYSSPSSSFNYKLRVSIPNVKAIVTYSSYGSGTNKSFTQAEKNSIYQYMVDNGLSSVSLGFVIETYNGTTKIGESSEPTRTVTRAGISSISTNANSYTTGNTIAITIGRNNSAYTHKLYHKLNGVNLSTTTPTTSENYTGMTAATFGAKYPTSTSGTLQLVLETYYNSVYLGNTSKTVTINLQSYSLPTPTLTLELVNSNAIVKGWGIYLRWYSQYKATVSGASGVYSSYVDKYSIGDDVGTTNTKTSGIISAPGTLTVNASYRDSRGRNSAVVSKSVTVHDYYHPVISSLSASRYNGTAVHEEGTQVVIKSEFVCASCNGKNAVSATAYIRADTTSTWTTLGTIGNNVNKVFSNVVLNINTVYIVRIVAKDSLGSEGAREFTVTTASASIDVLKGGNGVAIGKMASVANLFDIGWNTKIKGTLEVIGVTADYTQTLFNKTSAFRHYTHAITDANGTAGWYRLGNLKDTWDSTNTIINIYSGSGYNGGWDQNCWLTIQIKDGWQATGSPTGAFGCFAEWHGSLGEGIEYRVIATSHNACTVWVKLPWGYYNGEYTVDTQGIWTNSRAFQTGAPGGVLQQTNLKRVAYSCDIFPINSVYMTYTNVNPGTFLGGTWSLIGQDRYIRGAGSSFGGGATGGSGTSGATTITEAQMPSHTHGIITEGGGFAASGWEGGQGIGTIRSKQSNYTEWVSSDKKGGGSSHTHSVTPQYIAIYFWRRTA